MNGSNVNSFVCFTQDALISIGYYRLGFDPSGAYERKLKNPGKLENRDPELRSPSVKKSLSLDWG